MRCRKTKHIRIILIHCDEKCSLDVNVLGVRSTLHNIDKHLARVSHCNFERLSTTRHVLGGRVGPHGAAACNLRPAALVGPIRWPIAVACGRLQTRPGPQRGQIAVGRARVPRRCVFQLLRAVRWAPCEKAPNAHSPESTSWMFKQYTSQWNDLLHQRLQALISFAVSKHAGFIFKSCMQGDIYFFYKKT